MSRGLGLGLDLGLIMNASRENAEQQGKDDGSAFIHLNAQSSRHSQSGLDC
jgi:hypothetical protein